ncbi:hypothetical protein EDB89DRAFT_1910920 [Lactarius sanguifluus]|nr:hypothetical protein EDB89DRAFT_1910920 [Lactarius sanguifluus]
MESDLSVTNDRKDSETGSELDPLDKSLFKYIDLGVWGLYIMHARLLRYLPISLKSRSTRESGRTSHTCGGGTLRDMGTVARPLWLLYLGVTLANSLTPAINALRPKIPDAESAALTVIVTLVETGSAFLNMLSEGAALFRVLREQGDGSLLIPLGPLPHVMTIRQNGGPQSRGQRYKELVAGGPDEFLTAGSQEANIYTCLPRFSPPVTTDASVHWHPQECFVPISMKQTVIFGSNGSGNTISKLPARIYDPTEGGSGILIDGHNIKTLGLADLRHATAILFQDYIHFPLSVLETISPWEAACLGGAFELIARLPAGMALIPTLSGPCMINIREDEAMAVPPGENSTVDDPVATRTRGGVARGELDRTQSLLGVSVLEGKRVVKYAHLRIVPVRAMSEVLDELFKVTDYACGCTGLVTTVTRLPKLLRRQMQHRFKKKKRRMQQKSAFASYLGDTSEESTVAFTSSLIAWIVSSGTYIRRTPLGGN